MVRNITPSMDKVWKLKVDRFMKLPSSLPPSPSPPSPALPLSVVRLGSVDRGGGRGR